MSRPRIDENQKRVVQVNIRLTAEENKKVADYATSAGLSPANWIRYKIFIGKNPPAKLSSLDTALYQELKKIGVNLNQIAHKLNAGEFPNDLRIIQHLLMQHLDRMLKALIDDSQHDQG